MSRRLIQQLRDAGTSRHSNHVRAGRDVDDDDDDDDVTTNRTALRMSLRHIRSLGDVTDIWRLHRLTLKVSLKVILKNSLKVSFKVSL